jgi:hypothetical protein
MSDDTKNRGNPDRQRISLDQEYEVRDWAEKFGVSPDELRAAVAQVGNQADAVERHLSGRTR